MKSRDLSESLPTLGDFHSESFNVDMVMVAVVYVSFQLQILQLHFVILNSSVSSFSILCTKLSRSCIAEKSTVFSIFLGEL